MISIASAWAVASPREASQQLITSLSACVTRIASRRFVTRPTTGRRWRSRRRRPVTVRHLSEGIDAEGEVVARSDVRPTLDEVEAVLPQFTGPIEQALRDRPDAARAEVERARARQLVEQGAIDLHRLAREVAEYAATCRSLYFGSSHSTPTVWIAFAGWRGRSARLIVAVGLRPSHRRGCRDSCR